MTSEAQVGHGNRELRRRFFAGMQACVAGAAAHSKRRMNDLGVLEVRVALKAGLVLRPRSDAGKKKKKE